MVPAPIFMEAMAQVVGWGVIHAHDFKLSAIMSLVEGFRFEDVLLRPGFTATIGGEILSTSRRDSLCRGWVDADGRRIATLDRIIFAHFQPVDPDAADRPVLLLQRLDARAALPAGGTAMSAPRVVVTGLGLATALGLSVEESWRRALAGESAVRALAGPEAAGAPIKSAGVVLAGGLRDHH